MLLVESLSELLNDPLNFVGVRRGLTHTIAVIAVFYLLSYIILFLIRLITGISIAGIGFLCLRRISYSPHPHINCYISKTGIAIHRPTFTRPGWFTIYIKNFQITVDPKYYGEPPAPKNLSKEDNRSSTHKKQKHIVKHGSLLFRLLRVCIKYGRYIDISAGNTAITLTDVASVVLGKVILRFDLSGVSLINFSQFSGTLDRHSAITGEVPVVCELGIKQLYLNPVGEEPKKSQKIFDHFYIEASAVVDTTTLDFKELALSCKFGTVNVPANKVINILNSMQELRPTAAGPRSDKTAADSMVKSASRSLAVVNKLIQITKEIELKVASVGVYKCPLSILKERRKKTKPNGDNTSFALSAKDVSLDLSRLNPKNPAFRFFFKDENTAHQAILTCSSLMLGLDHKAVQEELMFVPLITATSKTNIFSKTFEYVKDIYLELNNTILRANINITTPSISLEPHHVGILLAAFSSSGSERSHSHVKKEKSSAFSFKNLLPRASVKLIVDEPAIRLLVNEPKDRGEKIPYTKKSLPTDLSGIGVLNCTKIFGDFVSKHTNDSDGKSVYSSKASLNISTFEAWYESKMGERYDFLSSESLLLQIITLIDPTISVSLSGQWDKVKVLAINSEIFYGLREVVYHIKSTKIRSRSLSVTSIESSTEAKKKNFFLKALPGWLNSFDFSIADVTVALAADEIERQFITSRGLKLNVQKLTLGYQRMEKVEELEGSRKLFYVIDGLSCTRIFDIFSQEKLNHKDIILDIAHLSGHLKSLSDTVGPLAEINCNVPSVLVSWDINTQYIISICISLVLRSLIVDKTVKKSADSRSRLEDFIDVKIRSGFVKVKTFLPNHQKLMLELNNFELTKSRIKPIALAAKFIRLYTKHPNISNAWARLLTSRRPLLVFKIDEHGNFSDDVDQIVFQSAGLRVNLVHQLVVYAIIDNLISAFKSSLTITKRALYNDPDYTISVKERKKMPSFPRIRIKTRKFLWTVEDDLFESKLSLIFEIGLREQRDRIEREALFEKKLAAVKLEKEENLKNMAAKEKQNSDKKHKNNDISSATFNANDQFLKIPEDRRSIKSFQSSGRAKHLGFRNFHSQMRSGPNHNRIRQKKNSEPQEHGYIVTEATDFGNGVLLSETDARYRLKKYFSTNWIKEYRLAEGNLKASIQAQMQTNPANDTVKSEILTQERIVAYTSYPFLFYMEVSDMDWLISKPVLSEDGLRDFLFSVGKGLPKDTTFSILVPLYNVLKCSSVRLHFRDYPLPLLHFPELDPSQRGDLPAVQIKGLFVLAENYPTKESSFRKVQVPLDPLALDANYKHANKDNPFILQLRKTVSSVKMYTDLQFDINTILPSRISWSVSTQPVIQTFMQTFDLLSKPPIDPSEKLGFWDKIRNVFHARLALRNTHGSIEFLLKGLRSPYTLVGPGAGFVMAWRNNVELTVNGTKDPSKSLQELIVVTSDEYVIAVPDYSVQESEYLANSFNKTGGLFCQSKLNEKPIFQKVFMKFSSRVRWVGGLLFERKVSPNSNKRTYDFRPHYEVELSNPSFIEDLEHYDAYKGFRSDYLHLAIAVRSMAHENGSQTLGDEEFYNSIHLTPRLFSHIFQWWGLFDGALSLPMRSGKLFTTQSNKLAKPKKFGRHLFSVKYQLQLAPLFFSHTYIQKSYHTPHHHRSGKSENNASHNDSKIESTVVAARGSNYNCVGLKAKIEKFSMDMHQRKSPKKSDSESGFHWKMGFNAGEIDLAGTDVRVVLAHFKDELDMTTTNTNNTSAATSRAPSIVSLSNSQKGLSSYGKFNIHDDDLTWVDYDDYTELEGYVPSAAAAKITILPLGYTPHWTYLRQTDLDTHNSGHNNCNNAALVSKDFVPFGYEPSHACLIGGEILIDTQQSLIKGRLDELQEQLHTNKAMVNSLSKDDSQVPVIEAAIAMINDRIQTVSQIRSRARDKVQIAIERSAQKISLAMNQEQHHDNGTPHCEHDETNSDEDGTSFSGRFIIHSFQMKWNNSVRNTLMKYLSRVGERRAFSYIVTQRAIKYLDDLVEKQLQQQQSQQNQQQNQHSSGNSTIDLDGKVLENSIGTIFQSLRSSSSRLNLRDDYSEEFPDEKDEDEYAYKRHNEELKSTEKTDNYWAEDQYLVKFVSPQVQLISEENPNMCILLTTESIELKSIIIKDKQHSEDTDESQKVVEIRYGAALQNAQFFVMSRDQIMFGPKDDELLSILFSSKNSYGTGPDTIWPPWLSVDCFYDSTPLKETLVIERTSVFFSYVKPNSLRIQANKKNVSSLSPASIRDTNNRQNLVKVDFPRVAVHCDSQQFFAMFTLVMDLLIYTEPAERERSERLDKVMLATDFSDLNNITDRINQLQNNVRNFQDIKMEFVTRLPTLSVMQLAELEKIEIEQNHTLLELFFMMEAIRTGMERKTEEDDSIGQNSTANSGFNGMADKFLKFSLGANQLILHILDSHRDPFLDIGLAEAAFNRIQGTDGFNINSLQLGIMQAFNLVPGTTYPELFAPYTPSMPGPEKKRKRKKSNTFLGISRGSSKQPLEVNDKNDDSDDENENNKSFVAIDWTVLDPIGGITIIENFDIDLKPIKLQIDSRTWDMLFEYFFPTDRDESPFNVRKQRGKKSSGDESESESESESDSDFDEESIHPRAAQPQKSQMKRSTTSSSLSSRLRKTTSFVVSNRGNGSHGSTASAEAAAAQNKDEISIMLNRASNYMSLVHARLKPTTMCVSYKRSDTSIFNIHELVIDLPEISYRNKTWSNLDLVLRLKRDVTKLLLGNTGRVVGNVLFSSKEQSKASAAAAIAGNTGDGKLRQLTDYKELMAVSELVQHNTNDESSAKSSAGFKRRLRSATNTSLKKLQLSPLLLSPSLTPVPVPAGVAAAAVSPTPEPDSGKEQSQAPPALPKSPATSPNRLHFYHHHHNHATVIESSETAGPATPHDQAGAKKFFKKLLK
jgi:hypothetical protein